MRLRLRLALTLLVTAFSIIYVLPSIPQVQDSPLSKFLPQKIINLGLDLKGGVHLTLGVDIDKAVEKALSQYGQDIKDSAQKEGAYVYRPQILPGHKLQFTLPKASDKAAIDKLLAESPSLQGLHVISSTQEGGQVRYTVELSSSKITEIESAAMEQTVKILRSRVSR